MKKRNVILLLILVALIFGSGGYLIGTVHHNLDSLEQEMDMAYQRGWSYWFSSYGMDGEGALYIDYYVYGRHYEDEFEDTYTAFSAGYSDAFYYINNEEVEEYDYFVEEMNEGYREYYEK